MSAPPKISVGALDHFRGEGRPECCQQIRNKSRKMGGRAGDVSITENKEGRKEGHLNCAAFDFKIARNESLVNLLL